MPRPVDTTAIGQKARQAKLDIEKLTVTVEKWTKVIRRGTQWANAVPSVSQCGLSPQFAAGDTESD